MGKSVSGVIGDKADALGEAGKTIAHGVTSGAIVEITGGKFAAGAAGGAISEWSSGWVSQTFTNPEAQVGLSQILGGLAAVAVTGDQNEFNTGAGRAETVYRYNYLEHKERSERDSLLREAKEGHLTEAQQARLAALNFKDALSDEMLLNACMGGSASECQAARKDALMKADSYPNLGYQYPKESLAGYQQIDRLLAGTTEEAIQTQRVYDGLAASYQRMGMSAENAKTVVGYQLGAMYIAGGVAGAKSMAVVERGLVENKLPNVRESSGAENAGNGLNLKKSLASDVQLAELSSGGGITMAGFGSDKILRDAPRLAAQYGGKAEDWSKVSSLSYTASDGIKFEVHAYRNAITGELVEPKSIPSIKAE